VSTSFAGQLQGEADERGSMLVLASLHLELTVLRLALRSPIIVQVKSQKPNCRGTGRRNNRDLALDAINLVQREMTPSIERPLFEKRYQGRSSAESADVSLKGRYGILSAGGRHCRRNHD
jgi:hypothetical protein